jgi:hypothetical protein
VRSGGRTRAEQTQDAGVMEDRRVRSGGSTQAEWTQDSGALETGRGVKLFLGSTVTCRHPSLHSLTSPSRTQFQGSASNTCKNLSGASAPIVSPSQEGLSDWIERRASNGRSYYNNFNTGFSGWENPEAADERILSLYKQSGNY